MHWKIGVITCLHTVCIYLCRQPSLTLFTNIAHWPQLCWQIGGEEVNTKCNISQDSNASFCLPLCLSSALLLDTYLIGDNVGHYEGSSALMVCSLRELHWKKEDYFYPNFTEECMALTLYSGSTNRGICTADADWSCCVFTKRRSSGTMAHHKSFSVDICEIDSDYQ